MLDTLRTAGFLSPLDVHFAETVARIACEDRPRVLLAAALASRQVSHGDVCLDLPRLSADPVPLDEAGEPIADLRWPDTAVWLDELRSSPIAATPDLAAESPRPLVVDARGRVYLHRYWDHQRRLAAALRARAVGVEGEIDRKLLRAGLDRLFPSAPRRERWAEGADAEPDRQRLAAAVAVLRRLCVISGGPGTGKTHTVVKILALLLEQARAATGSPRLRIHLLAPTGKAAARLGEAIRTAKANLACDDDVRAAIPDRAATIHRCLGSIRDSDTRFRFDADTPLLADVVLVDEASMVALALMARLTDALPADARLILLGDKDQLASVEAGAVLGDICDTGRAHAYTPAFARELERFGGNSIPSAGASGGPPMSDCVVELERNYRYGAESAIGRLARAVNRGDVDKALSLLGAGSDEVSLIEPKGSDLPDALARAACRKFEPLFAGASAAERLGGLDHFRLLCAHRRGPLGVEDVNRRIELALAAEGLLRPRRAFYDGQPVLVTQNDYQVGLFNGDVGLIIEERAGPDTTYAACFIGADGKLRRLAPSRMPPHETAFAMTVHRSQGSEFDEVVVVLPERASPIVTRELLYTAITRARRKVTVCAGREIVAAAVARPIERASGLRDEIWGV